MAGKEESSISVDCEEWIASSPSEDNQDPEPSTSSSQPAPIRKARARNSASLIGPPENPSGAEAHGGPSTAPSATSGGQPKLPMPKLDLKALFDYHSRRRQLRSKSRKTPRPEAATERKSPEPPTKRPRFRPAKEKRQRRGRERYLQFPFMQKLYGKKHVPLRMECLFEQETLEGFFKYIEMLKFEHHLKKSLSELDATEDLEKESLLSRKHKYLDDEGPLSPIEETAGEGVDEDGDTEDIGARIVTSSLEPPKMSTAKKDSGRSFQEVWTESFGVIECNGKALCTLCSESVVCRTSSVRRHFETRHKSVAALGESERKVFLEGKLTQYNSQDHKYDSQPEDHSSCETLSKTNHLTAASFQISLYIVKHGKPLSDGDSIKKAMLSGSDALFQDFPNKDKILQWISEIPLSRNTVKDRVQRMANDVSQQLATDIQKAACYSMCLDESTDINNHARLAVILRYAAGDVMREELVKLVSLPERTQGIDIYSAVMEAFLSQGIRPEKVVSVTSDGAPSMVGATSSFMSFFVKEAKHPVIPFHCILHQDALCAGESSKKFDTVLKDVTEMVNYIAARALNFPQFKALLEEVQAQYNGLRMYNNVRWLSRGRVLERFVACLDEIRLFMNEKRQDYPQLADMAWLCNLMFFTDFTLHFNVLNKQLQGAGRTAERMFCDLKTFERKLQVFERDLESGQLKYFPSLKMHLENSTAEVPNLYCTTDRFHTKPFFQGPVSGGGGMKLIDWGGGEGPGSTAQFGTVHGPGVGDLCSTAFAANPANPTRHQEICNEFSFIVATVKGNFSNRFLQFRKMETTLCFLTCPDKTAFEELDLSSLQWLDLGNLEMELIEFQENSIWKNKFQDLRETLEKIEGMTKEDGTVSSENEILKAWNSLPNNFKSMKALGIALLTLFGSTSACEQLFSSLNYIKSDTRNRLTDDLSAACVVLKLTKYEPRVDNLSARIQQQKSH